MSNPSNLPEEAVQAMHLMNNALRLDEPLEDEAIYRIYREGIQKLAHLFRSSSSTEEKNAIGHAYADFSSKLDSGEDLSYTPAVLYKLGLICEAGLPIEEVYEYRLDSESYKPNIHLTEDQMEDARATSEFNYQLCFSIGEAAAEIILRNKNNFTSINVDHATTQVLPIVITAVDEAETNLAQNYKLNGMTMPKIRDSGRKTAIARALNVLDLQGVLSHAQFQVCLKELVTKPLQ